MDLYDFSQIKVSSYDGHLGEKRENEKQLQNNTWKKQQYKNPKTRESECLFIIIIIILNIF